MKRSTQRNWRNLQLVEGGLLYCKCRRTELQPCSPNHSDGWHLLTCEKHFHEPIISLACGCGKYMHGFCL